ncbi:MAG: hypothetical protein MUQ76_12865, partial [Reinekea forsetii]|nr:hypothetical protein [Reinekea forsetii]
MTPTLIPHRLRGPGRSTLLVTSFTLLALSATVWANSSVQERENQIERPIIAKNFALTESSMPVPGLVGQNRATVAANRDRYIIGLVD